MLRGCEGVESEGTTVCWGTRNVSEGYIAVLHVECAVCEHQAGRSMSVLLPLACDAGFNYWHMRCYGTVGEMF